MSKFKLTIRHGPKVSRQTHGSLEDAVAALRAETERIRDEGGLPEVSAFKTYEPSALVEARLEISTGGVLRGKDAGIDVMGDGGIVAFRGGVTRKPIETTDGQTPFQAIEAALRA